MKKVVSFCAVAAMWGGAVLNAQANDYLDQLSSPPQGLPAVVSAEVQSTDAADNSVVPVGHESCSSRCGGCQAGCGPCDDGGWMGGDWLSGDDGGLLGQVFALPNNWFGLDLHSDRCFERFIEPVTNSVFFEDPRSRTRVRFLFINQQIPESTPALAGGDFQVYGMQATFALSDRLSVLAQKDGWINLQADGLPHQDGWANLATGLKYVLIRDVENQFLVSTGFMMEWTNGSGEVFQGTGQNVWTPFVSVGKEFNCNTHFVSTIGYHLPQDGDDSESFYYSAHIDHAITEKLYALAELNGLHYTDDGGRLPVPFEGGDLINLGSTGAAGNYLLTAAFGGACKINRNWESAAAYEIPLAGKGDIFEERLTFTLSFIY